MDCPVVRPPARLPLSGSREPYQVNKEGHLLVGSGISGYFGGTQEERKQPESIGIAVLLVRGVTQDSSQYEGVRGLHCFLEAQEQNAFPCLFQLLAATCVHSSACDLFKTSSSNSFSVCIIITSWVFFLLPLPWVALCFTQKI